MKKIFYPVGILVLTVILLFFVSGFYNIITQRFFEEKVNVFFNVTPSVFFNENYLLMGIGEENTVKWNIKGFFDVEPVVPNGFEILNYSNNTLKLRAVKVGKWNISLSGHNIETNRSLIICVGITKEKAKQFCDD